MSHPHAAIILSPSAQPGKVPQIEAVNIMTGGKAKFTILNTKTGNRFTYRVMCPPDKPKDLTTLFFVHALTGQDNDHSYSYIGLLRFSNGAWRFDYGRKAKISEDAPCVQAFAYVFNQFWSLYRTHPDLELWHEGTCCRCGRTLTVPDSIASGIGPECARIRSLAHR